MPSSIDLRETIFDAWKTNNRVTIYLIEHLPAELWEARLPGVPRRTIRMLAAHIHNVRCTWIKTLGKQHGVVPNESVDRWTVTAKELAEALHSSASGIMALLKLACEHEGRLPDSSSYMWRNLPLDVGHILSYFVAHEGHHRGQIVMLARQLGHRLPIEVTGGLWQWSKRSRER